MRLVNLRYFSLCISITAFLLVVSSFIDADRPFQQQKITDKAEAYFSFAKAYGYIRYFYPSDESSLIDWDRFAWYGASKITNSQLPVLLELSELFSSIGSNISFAPTGSIKSSPRLFNDTSTIVFWQHLGDGKESIRYPFKSMRVNRLAKKLPESSNDFGSISKLLLAEKYKGKKVRVRTHLQIDGSFIGAAYLTIAYKPSGADSRSITTQGQKLTVGQWETHELITDIPDNTEKCQVVITTILQTGSVMINNLEIDTEIDKKWVLTDSYDFNKVEKEKLSTEWKPFGPNQDIEVLHIKDQKVIRFTRSSGALQIHPPLFKISIPEQQYLIKNIGTNLQIGFPLVLQLKNEHTFPQVPLSKLALLKNELAAISDTSLTNVSINTRIANVILLWNRLQHFHPDNPFQTAEWDVKLKNAIKRSLTDNSIEDHRETLTQMVRDLNDSHMTMYYSSTLYPDFYLPIQWDLIEGKLMITKVLDQNLDLKAGTIIHKVDNIPAIQYWQKILSNTIGATASRRSYKAIEESLRGNENSEIIITIKTNNNTTKTYILKRTLNQFAYNKASSSMQTLQKFKSVSPGVYYVNLEQIPWNELEGHIQELAEAKGIIFDVRGYPKWRNIEILKHLTRKTILGVTDGIPRIIYPDREKMSFDYQEPIEYQPSKPFFMGRIVFLTNGKALSYAENVMEIVQYYRLGTIIGDKTAGTTGTINMCYLFGGLMTPWTGMRVLKQDGSLYNGRGVTPDISVRPSIRGIKNNEDELINYALQLINKK